MNPSSRTAPFVIAPAVIILALAGNAPADEPAAPAPLVAAGGTSHAAEPEGRLPLAQAERPLTLPKFVLSTDVTFSVPYLSASALGGNSSATFANLSVGASFGINDDATVRVTVLPLQLAGPANNGFHYGQSTAILGYGDIGPSVGGTYRIVHGDVEVGLSLDGSIVTVQTLSGGVIAPGVPVRIHAGESVRVDTGLNLAFNFLSVTELGQSATANSVAMTVPLSVLVDVTPPLHLGAATAFGINDFSNPGTTSFLPLSLFAGYAIGGKDGPILDIDPFFTFPFLITPGATQATESGYWVAGVTVGGFFYL